MHDILRSFQLYFGKLLLLISWPAFVQSRFLVSEYQALSDLYQSLDGDNWFWSSDTESYGIRWDFAADATNGGDPCADRWQGIHCTCIFEESSDPLFPHTQHETHYDYADYLETYYISGGSPSVVPNTTTCFVRKLDLTDYGLTGKLPSSLTNLTHLQAFQLAKNRISGPVDPFLWNLSHLETFVAGANAFTGSIPAFIDQGAPNLTYLALTDSGIASGRFPESLCNLTKLRMLMLGDGYLTGTLPECIGRLTQLDTFSVALSCFTGSLPRSICNWERIQDFTVSVNSFSGELPDCFGNSGTLEHVSLDRNGFTGELPPSLCLSTHLVSFTTKQNHFTGSIPACFGRPSMDSLHFVDLGYSLLSGTIPFSLWNISSLSIDANRIEGTIPEVTHTIMEYLSISHNLFQGAFPSIVCDWQHLTSFSVGSNEFTGSLSSACLAGWGDKLENLYLDGNYFEGSLPDEACTWSSIIGLEISSNLFSGSLPACIDNWANPLLQSVYIGQNMFEGTLPAAICAWTTVKFLQFDTNFFTGSLPSCIGAMNNTKSLYLLNNQFNGSLPDGICKLLYLHYFQIYENQFSGSLPSCMGELISLFDFYFWGNRITGTVSSSWCDISMLSVFDGSDNRLQGTIPPCLWDSQYLVMLGLDMNNFTGPLFLPESECGLHSVPNLRYLTTNDDHFTGSIPWCIDQFAPLIQSLVLSKNHFNGTIPEAICSFRDLDDLELFSNAFSGVFPDCWAEIDHNLVHQIFISDNMFVGTLPESFCNFPNIVSLQLGNNQFEGTIPTCYGSHLQQVQFFNVSSNDLSGSLPESLCGMNKTVSFFAAVDNKLTGRIPACFGSLDQLKYLFLSSNQLTGPLTFLRHDKGAFQLVELSVDNNKLTGHIFEDLLNTAARPLTELLAQRNRFSGSLPSSAWEERFDTSLSNAFGALTVIDLSENLLEGELDATLFRYTPMLTSLMLIKNCFSGQLSEDICSAASVDGVHQSVIEVLALDGLSAGCDTSENLYGTSIRDSSQSSRMHGSIPACLFMLPSLRVLHAAGNSFDGSLPADDASSFGANLTDLSLSHNDLRGTIPVALQCKSWSNLDLAFNKLDGSLVECSDRSIQDSVRGSNVQVLQEEEWSVSDRTIKLNRNRLSGVVPDQYLTADDINMLDGNLFSCKFDARQQLPKNDPNADNYTCGTDGLNLMLFVGLGLITIALLLVWLWVNCWPKKSTVKEEGEEGDSSTGNKSQLPMTVTESSTSSPVSPTGMYGERKEDSSSSSYQDSADISFPSSQQTSEDDCRPRDTVSISSVSRSMHSIRKAGYSPVTELTQSNQVFIELRDRCIGSMKVLRSDLQSLRFSAVGRDISSSSLSSSMRTTPQHHTAPSERFARFLQCCDHQRRLFLGIAAVSIFILLPLYFGLTLKYKTHSSSYAWIVSSVYLSGTLPAAVLLSLWTILFASLYRAVDPEMRFRGRGAVMRKILQRLYQMSVFWQEYSMIAIALFVNAVILLLINGVYVWVVIHNGREVSTSLQIMLAAFKLVYNGRFVSKIVRGSEWLNRLRKRQRLLKKGIKITAIDEDDADLTSSNGESLLSDAERYGDGGLIPGIYSEAALVVFNFVIVPIIAAAFVDSNCFYEAIVPPQPLQTSLTINSVMPVFSYSWQSQQAVYTSTAVPTELITQTVFDPPFAYSGQCTSSIIATYVPVFVMLYLANLFVLPAIMLLRRAYFKQQPKDHDENGQPKEQSVLEILSGTPKKPSVLRSLNFDRRSYVVSRVTNLSVLLTFGWVFPPLAVLIALVEVRDSIYLVAALQQYIIEAGGMIAAEKELGWHVKGIATSLPYLQLRYLPMGSFFLALLIYDIAGDELGLLAGLWAPFLLIIAPWLIDQIAIFWQMQSNLYKSQQRLFSGAYVRHSTHDYDDRPSSGGLSSNSPSSGSSPRTNDEKSFLSAQQQQQHSTSPRQRVQFPSSAYRVHQSEERVEYVEDDCTVHVFHAEEEDGKDGHEAAQQQPDDLYPIDLEDMP